ncbi:uncharacterized protein L969DRAFT_44522 [Mixia osmundae IAM 14324]|uniref:GPI transamidase component PIG-T n=1 Tax=Mixia osmundae (strain CBS 9802 / IAM 14324 / JCM 22182 / KY 12970) TaxID=764103 RepID=G7DYJ0_MIXOS|nr:uncharacterized protein L969DRAFT_44522 [Mixia osmundae IAM 14324]KEI41551.1 hypothetical protein L969DRAFT_44522 [Mixia osmundae IAM 14324]GAA95650.1 hypothetical protein E5Q_02306 [Mixia osmundae IAM 14324]
MHKRWLSYITLAVAPVCLASVNSEHFAERLDLASLPDGRLSAAFTFRFLGPLKHFHRGRTSPDGHTRLYTSERIPRQLASIIRAFGVRELHLSLTAGSWDQSAWGLPHSPHAFEGSRLSRSPIAHASASGAELWAWLDSSDANQWTGLTNSLAGLFCASLNRLDLTRTTSPVLQYGRESSDAVRNATLYHGMLPLEHPCTENLTPFISLLPCKAQAGLASLLNPHRLFDADYQNLAIDILTHADEIEIVMQAKSVLNPIRLDRAKGGPGKRDWSFEHCLERELKRSCPAASESFITIVQPTSTHSLVPDGFEFVAEKLLSMSVSNVTSPLDVSMRWPQEGQFVPEQQYAPAPITVKRVLLGKGQERGQIGVDIANHLEQQIDVGYNEELPWWMTIYLHTLKIEQLTLDLQSVQLLPGPASHALRYVPANVRGRPALIEAKLTLPARSVVRVLLNYEAAYLRYTEYPSDAHRGFDIPAAAVFLPEGPMTGSRRIYSSSALLSMPTPDFSMPYNVIILTSTCIALFFGSIFNLMTRELFAIQRVGISTKAE